MGRGKNASHREHRGHRGVGWASDCGARAVKLCQALSNPRILKRCEPHWPSAPSRPGSPPTSADIRVNPTKKVLMIKKRNPDLPSVFAKDNDATGRARGIGLWTGFLSGQSSPSINFSENQQSPVKFANHRLMRAFLEKNYGEPREIHSQQAHRHRYPLDSTRFHRYPPVSTCF